MRALIKPANPPKAPAVPALIPRPVKIAGPMQHVDEKIAVITDPILENNSFTGFSSPNRTFYLCGYPPGA